MGPGGGGGGGSLGLDPRVWGKPGDGWGGGGGGSGGRVWGLGPQPLQHKGKLSAIAKVLKPSVDTFLAAQSGVVCGTMWGDCYAMNSV